MKTKLQHALGVNDEDEEVDEEAAEVDQMAKELAAEEVRCCFEQRMGLVKLFVSSEFQTGIGVDDRVANCGLAVAVCASY